MATTANDIAAAVDQIPKLNFDFCSPDCVKILMYCVLLQTVFDLVACGFRKRKNVKESSFALSVIG